MNTRRTFLLCLLFNVSVTLVLGQQLSPDTAFIHIPSDLPSNVDQKIKSLDISLTKRSQKYLKDFARQEEKLLKKLSRIDSSAAASMLQSGKEKYAQLSQKLSKANGKAATLLSGEYLSGLDSLQGSLGFLKDAKNVISKSKGIQQQLGKSLDNLKELKSKLDEAGDIQQYVQERQAQLQQLLSNYTNLPKDLGKYFGKYQQQVFYYSQQLQEYKEVLNDPDKLTKKVLAALRQLPAFQAFMRKHSMLAALFPTPENYGTAQALTGLQTRASVQQVLRQQLPAGTTGGNPGQYLQQQLQQAQGELSKLKDKMNQLGIKGAGSSDMALPENFSPNSNKTKSFFDRIDIGTMFQTQRAGNYFPTTLDAAITAAYRLTDKMKVGVGISGKMGFGKSWKHIKVTGESVGTRVFAEWKAPDLFKTNSRFMGSLWLYSSAETNYNRTIQSLADFKNYSNWSRSAMAGLSKKYSLSSPLKKDKKIQGNMQLLYDFMHRKNIPNTPALVWRVGYEF
ncbi:MAG: hypothetical protein ACTHMM_12170 [Agriterribacter sp.]